MGGRALICDAAGCRQPATPHATYWIPGHRWFHLCREHWAMIGPARDELRRLLGIEPDPPGPP